MEGVWAMTREADIMAFLKSSKEENGYPPTRKEIATRFGWKSANAAQEQLGKLEAKGLIEIAPNVSRGIKIL